MEGLDSLPAIHDTLGAPLPGLIGNDWFESSFDSRCDRLSTDALLMGFR